MSGPLTVEELRERLSQFGVYEYVVFFFAVVGCALAGIYCALSGTKSFGSAEEYLLGGRSMSSFPVAMSLTASFVGLTILKAPAEIYLYGTEYAFAFITFLLTGLASSYVFLPILHQMKLLSAFEYLERRFDENVRFFGCLLFAVTQVCWLPTVVYVPASAFSEVTGMDFDVVTGSVCFLCVLHACLGGLRAVAWTNVFQIILTMACMLFLTTKGSLNAGGFQKVWLRNYHGGRLIVPTFDWDFTLRHNFWGITVGGLVSLAHEAILNQNMYLMYLSLPSLSHARRASWMFVFGTIALFLVSCSAGLVIYATYHDCDPLTTKLVRGRDELLPLAMVKVAAELPGLSGLLTAGVLGACLSSFSTGLISTSAVVLQDFVKPLRKRKTSGRARDVTMRGVVLLSGIFFSSLIIVLEKLEVVLWLPTGLASMTSGPMLGIFFSGMFLPWVNAKGALLGGILGLFGSGFVIIGAQSAIAQDKLKFPPKPTSVEACLYYYNATSILSLAGSDEKGNVFPLFRLGYLWHTALGAFITSTSAVAISALTGFTDLRRVNPVWFSPAVRNLLPLSKSRSENKNLLKR